MRGCLSGCLGVICLVAVVGILAGGGAWSLVAGLVLVGVLAAIIGTVLGVFEGLAAGLFGRR